MSRIDDEDIPTYTEVPPEEQEDEQAEEQEFSKDVMAAAANTTTDLDDILTALWADKLDEFDDDAAAAIALQVSSRMLGRALGSLILMSNEPEACAKNIMHGLELGVGRSIDGPMVFSREGVATMEFVRRVSDRFIEAVGRAMVTAIRTMPNGESSGD